MKNADNPINPTTETKYHDGEKYNLEHLGLTKREYACIHLGIPETNDEELNDIIRKAERKRIIEHVMQGFISSYDWDVTKFDIYLAHVTSENALKLTDTLLNQLNQNK